MTDVSLREFIETKLDDVADQQDLKLNALAAKSAAAQEAAKELAEKHNDLLRKGERDAATYATKDETEVMQERSDERFKRVESTLSRATGAIGVIGLIGVANLVKLFAG